MVQSKLTWGTTNNPDKGETQQHRCCANPAETKERATEMRPGEFTGLIVSSLVYLAKTGH